MKAILEFDLNDEFDKENYELTMKASMVHQALLYLDTYLRNKIKYEEHEFLVHETFSLVRQVLHDELLEQGIEI